MLRFAGAQVESLWDEVLPAEVRELPEDLARLDRLLSDATLFSPIAAQWRPRRGCRDARPSNMAARRSRSRSSCG